MTFSFLHRLLGKKSKVEDRFSLHSGERQTGLRLAEIRADHTARYEYACATIMRHVPTGGDAFGLDLFCGTGYGTQILSSTTKCTTLGIDASIEAIATANSYYSSEQTLFSAKVFPFALPRRTFDYVVCLESIEHVQETDRFLEEIVGALRPGGLLILSTPNADIWSLEINPNPFHFRHFTRTEVLATLSRHFGYQMEVLDWQGQDIYQLSDGRIVQPLPSEKMNLRSDQEGQILVFTVRKLA
ncbi:MAG: class I SAM-dependent methyltransferase [Sulfuritalea sp.]|nr:class I SAM-dependent methyltransferase [Sulfuritalea sp.]